MRLIVLLVLLLLAACQVTVESGSSSITGNVVDKVNETNETILEPPVSESHPIPSNPTEALMLQQKKLYEQIVEVKKRIAQLGKDLKNLPRKEEARKQLTQAYHEKEYLESRIRELDEKIQGDKRKRRLERDEQELTKNLEKLKEEERL